VTNTKPVIIIQSVKKKDWPRKATCLLRAKMQLPYLEGHMLQFQIGFSNIAVKW